MHANQTGVGLHPSTYETKLRRVLGGMSIVLDIAVIVGTVMHG